MQYNVFESPRININRTAELAAHFPRHLICAQASACSREIRALILRLEMRTLRAAFHTIFWIANCLRYSEAITPPNMFRSRFPRIGLSVQRSFIRSFSNHKMPGLRHDFTYGIDKFMGPGAFEISWTNYQKLMIEKLNQAIAGGYFLTFSPIFCSTSFNLRERSSLWLYKL